MQYLKSKARHHKLFFVILRLFYVFSLKGGSQLLKYGKYVITHNSDPDGPWYRSSEEAFSSDITTVKTFLMCPGLLMYDPEIIPQLIGFTLNNFTELGQVLTNV